VQLYNQSYTNEALSQDQERLLSDWVSASARPLVSYGPCSMLGPQSVGSGHVCSSVACGPPHPAPGEQSWPDMSGGHFGVLDDTCKTEGTCAQASTGGSATAGCPPASSTLSANAVPDNTAKRMEGTNPYLVQGCRNPAICRCHTSIPKAI